MKALIFDSSSLINLTMNGLIEILIELKKIFNGKLIITQHVKYETIDRQSSIRKYELGSLQIKKLLDTNILEMPSSLGIQEQEIKETTKEILSKVNSSYYAKEFMHIIDEGEASCLATSLIANKKKIENLIVIDERTTRMIVENPENLRKLFESKLHSRIILQENFDYLKNTKFIRSAELLFVAYKKGLIKLGKENVLQALLYASKYKGCAISEEEIREIEKMA